MAHIKRIKRKHTKGNSSEKATTTEKEKRPVSEAEESQAQPVSGRAWQRD